MRRKYSNVFHAFKFACGFTLIELLVVMAVISLILAILLPMLGKARAITRRLTCQGNLKQITLALHLYLNDSEGAFLQGVNVNHEFGGWVGLGGFAPYRPLNDYLGLPFEIQTRDIAMVFRCSTDRGGISGYPSYELAYDIFGNSYQTNILLIGPDQVGNPGGKLKKLHEAINARLRNINIGSVSKPSHLLLVGDNNWVSQWLYIKRPHSRHWHDKPRYHNLAFLDGHIGFIKVRKGLYITPEYTVLPFNELYDLAYEVQEEVP